MIEVWKNIPGYDGKYQANTEGQIRRAYKNGKTRLLTPYQKIGNRRFVYVVKLTKDHKGKEETVLSLIARTFLGPVPKGYTPYHINGCKSENNIQNIAYISRKQLGKLTGSSSRRKSVLKFDSGGNIVDCYSSAREAGEKNYMSGQTVTDYCNGKCKGTYAPDGYAYAWEDDKRSMRRTIAKIEKEEGYMPKAPKVQFEW